MSRASKYSIIFVCLKNFFLYIAYLFVFFLLQCVFSYNFEKNIRIDIDSVYKFLGIEITVRPISYVEVAIGDTRGNRIVLPHVIHQKTDGYRAMM